MFPSILVEYTAEDQSQPALAKRRASQSRIFFFPLYEQRPNLKVETHLINRIKHARQTRHVAVSTTTHKELLDPICPRIIRLHVLKRLLGTRQRK